MEITLFLIGVIVFVVAMAIIYRVFSLMDMVKVPSEEMESSEPALGNNTNAFMLMAFAVLGTIGAIWSSVYYSKHFLPVSASEHGVETDSMFWLTMAIIGFVFIFTNILLLGFAYVYRFKKGRTALYYPHNDKLEMIWTAIPAIVLTILVIMGWMTWSKIFTQYEEGTDVTKIEIMGKQFNWMVRYPGKDGKFGGYHFRRTSSTNEMGLKLEDPAVMDDFIQTQEIHFPVGKPVTLQIRARDVIHSVFLPHFRVKMDAVPGHPTYFNFTPTITTDSMRQILSEDPEYQEVVDPETGQKKWQAFNYEMACTEICGRGHYSMRLIVVVDTPEQYEKWLAKQPLVSETLKADIAKLNGTPKVEVVEEPKNENDTTSDVNNDVELDTTANNVDEPEVIDEPDHGDAH